MTHFLGVDAAGAMYEAGFGRSAIVARLQDPIIMGAMAEPRAYTETEAIAAYEAVAIPFMPADRVLTLLLHLQSTA